MTRIGGVIVANEPKEDITIIEKDDKCKVKIVYNNYFKTWCIQKEVIKIDKFGQDYLGYEKVIEFTAILDY